MVARLSIYPQGAPFLYTVESGLENECVLSIHVLTVVLIVYTVYLLYLFIYLLFFFSTVRVHGVANWASVHKQQALNMAGR